MTLDAGTEYAAPDNGDGAGADANSCADTADIAIATTAITEAFFAMLICAICVGNVEI